MGDYEVGYGKPPKETRFKPGTSGNPKGRPRRDRSSLDEIVNNVLDALVTYRENGQSRTATTREVALKLLVQRAVKGDVGAADVVRRKRTDALRRSGGGSNQLLIQDWLPDRPGQTAEQKTQELASAAATPAEETDPTSADVDQTSKPEENSQEGSPIGSLHASTE